MSGSPFDGSLLSGLLGDEEIAAHLSAEAELREMLRIELALAQAEAEEGVIPRQAAQAIATAWEGFAPDLERIRSAAKHDGVTPVELVRQLREQVGEPVRQFVHLGATSQDLVDTALVLRLVPMLEILSGRIRHVQERLATLDRSFGQNTLMGRTRMQDALPITVHDRLSTWDVPLTRHQTRLDELRPRLLLLQFGGAVGTLDRLGDRGAAVAARLAAALGLGLPGRAWHSQRDCIVELAGWLSLVTGSLGKLGADIALMAQNRVAEIALRSGGGSSAMPHKQNPVGAEVLVSLAHFNAAQVAGMYTALVHEQERSGAAWTLEWMLLPQMLMTTGASLRTAIELLDNVDRIGGNI